MLGKRTIAEVRDDLDRHAETLSADLKNTADMLATAVVLVGAIAVAALLVALLSNN